MTQKKKIFSSVTAVNVEYRRIFLITIAEKGRNNKYAYISDVRNNITDETRWILKVYRSYSTRYFDYGLFGLF